MNPFLLTFLGGLLFGFSIAVLLFRWLDRAPLVRDGELDDEKFFDDQ